MKRISAALCVFLVTSAAHAQSGVEKAEKRIAELVAPGTSASPALAARPVLWKAGRVVEVIDVPIRPASANPVRLPPSPIKSTKPGSVAEGQPLASFRDGTQAPMPVELPTKPLIWLPTMDMHAPLAIPILATPTKDRASLGDPAFDASLAAAMKRFTPTRDRPVPFTPYNLPDPFEHVRYGQLRQPPEESANPPVIPMQSPGK